MDAAQSRTAARAWLRGEQRAGGRAARPVLVFSLVGTVLAIGQVWCVAFLLADAVTRRADHAAWSARPASPSLALLRAGLAYVSETAAFNAGAAARRRLRTDALTRLLHAGPAHAARHAIRANSPPSWWTGWRRWTASIARWIPAASFAVAGPVLVLLAGALGRSAGRAGAAAVPACWCRWRWRRPASARRPPRAASSWRWRGCRRGSSTGCAASPPSCWPAAPKPRRARWPAAADELRRRTMRVLRVAFLSSAALDLAAAAALVVLAIRYGLALLAGRLAAARPGAVRAAAGAGVLRAAARPSPPPTRTGCTPPAPPSR